MKYFWKLLSLCGFLAASSSAPAYFNIDFPMWTASTSVYNDDERVYVSASTEADFSVFWTEVSTSLYGGSGGSQSDYSSGSSAFVYFSVPIAGQYGNYSAFSYHTVMDTDGIGYHDNTQGSTYVQPPPPPPPPPTISGISPSSVIAGASGSIQVSGAWFRPGATLTSSASGLTVSGGYSNSDSTISGNYTATTPGNYSVSVTQDSGSASIAFTVGDPTPQITSIDPVWFDPGSSTPVRIVGTGFGSSPTVPSSSSDIVVTVLSASNNEINAMVNVSNSAVGEYSLQVESHGVSGTGFLQSGGSSARSSGSTVRVRTLTSVSQVLKFDGNIVDPLHLSTGDSSGRTITTSVLPQAAGFNVTHDIVSFGNPNSSCAASLTIPNGSGTGYVNSSISASPGGCSGIFQVRARANGVASSNTSYVVVPPQALIQMMIGEAGGQSGDASQPSVGVAARNRLGDRLFGGYWTLQEVISHGGFYGASNPTANGPQPTLSHAANVFTGDSSTIGIVENAKCFWSPTTAQWARVQEALQSQTTAFPQNTGASTCWDESERQILYKTSIGTNNRGGSHEGAPAFLFLQRRDATAPAVKQIN